MDSDYGDRTVSNNRKRRKTGNVVPMPTAKRKYDAGSNASRLSSWYAPSTDATAAIQAPAKIRNRARDLVRNSPWANKALSVLANNIIGYGIRCQIKGKSKARTKRAQDLWKAHFETTACDADGRNNIYGLQALALRSLCESGECLVRFRPRKASDNLPLPFQLQVIEPDLIADSISSQAIIQLQNGGKNQVIRGIEYDSIGRRVAYYLYKVHPGAEVLNLSPGQYSRVPAEEIIHLFRKDRPGQERGVTWLAPVVVTLRELGIYEDAYLKRQQLANLFAGFMYSDNPADLDIELEDEIPDLQPGTIYLMKNGRRIEWSTPPPSGEDPKYRDSCLRRIAAGIGITYESLTGDLSNVNFSSGRMGAHEMGRNIDSWQWNTFIPTFCDGVFKWFLDALAVKGIDTTDLSVEWSPPARTVVDPNKEFEALLAGVKAGFMTLPEAIRQQGYDPDAIITEQAEYLAKLDEAGLKVESDFRNEVKSAPKQDAGGNNGLQN